MAAELPGCSTFSGRLAGGFIRYGLDKGWGFAVHITLGISMTPGNPRRLAQLLLKAAVCSAVMYVAIQVALAYGVERKTWLQLSWEFIAGGSVGAIAGVAFFLVFGAVGWVCGALYGSVGLIALMFGGALGGLGLGAVANILRNPQSYEFDWAIIIASLSIGLLLAHVLSSLAVRLVSRRFPPSPGAADA